jgi:hypothetical protein
LGRYLLAVIDQEIELLQIAARTPMGLSERLDTAYAALIDGLTAELAEWIGAWCPRQTEQKTAVLAALGVNGLLGARFATSLFRQRDTRLPDDDYLIEWTLVLAARIGQLERN